LKYPPVRFTGLQARAIARGIEQAVQEHEYVIHALAILPDHLHLVIKAHSRSVDQIAAHLKAKATVQMTRENMHPLEHHAGPAGRRPSPWSRNYWCPFIRSASHYQRAIEYVELNPVKAGLRKQTWSLVQSLQ
jgi:REP element-mobilizing transposase RayT